MSTSGQILRVAVIGNEEDTRRMQFFDEWQQGIQVPCSRAFTDHEPHAQANTLARLRKRGTFVIGHHARRSIGTEVALAQPWSMSIDNQAMFVRGYDLCQYLLIAMQHTRHIHHFGEAEDTFVFKQG